MTYDSLTKAEERFIQYGKLVLALVVIGMLWHFLDDKSILLICR